MAPTWSTDGGIHEIPVAHGAGRVWLCGKQYIGPDVESVLAVTGADAVVCLTNRHEIDERYPDYTAWLDREAGSRALWHPIDDLSYPPVAEIRPTLDECADRLRAGRGLVIHCAAGIGRSGTTAVALLIALGSPRDTAVDVVRTHRPGAGPETGAQAEFVAEWAVMMEGPRSPS